MRKIRSALISLSDKSNIKPLLQELRKNNIKIIKVSSYYESFSWPDKKKPKFLNIVISVVTSLKLGV